MLSGEEYHDDENYDEKLRDVDLDQPRARRRGIVNCNSCLFLFLFILLLTLFFELTFWHMLFGPRAIHSINPDDSSTTITYPQEQLPEFARTNGTNVFSPTTILLVVSGLGSSMLHTNSTPNLMSIAEQGVAPLHLTPPFPALEAPCLWTLTTGLNPISHGVVSDNFFDSKLNATYNFTGLTAASKRYWSADNNTIWQVAKDQNISTVVLNWPCEFSPTLGPVSALLTEIVVSCDYARC